MNPAPSSTRPRLPLRVAIAVGVVAGCVLALQVLLTRLFSAALFYHFSFLSISLALLGAGAGAMAVYIRPQWFERRPLEQELSRLSTLLAGLLLLIPMVLVRIRYGTSGEVTTTFALLLTISSALTTVLFGVAGTVIALAVRGYAHTIARLYAFDLAGAALGALAVVPLMWIIDVPALIVALAPVAAFAAVLFAGKPSKTRVRAPIVLLAVGVVGVAIAAQTELYEPKPVDVPADVEPIADRWTPLSRVLGYGAAPEGSFAPLYYDRVAAPVARYRRGGSIPDWRDLGLGVSSLGYAMGNRDRALIIGGGGGRDILNALSSGVNRVEVIELNRAIRDTVDGPLRQFSGAPYSLPRVRTTIGDGRSTLAGTDAKYGVIHIGFTDTLSAGSAQAFTLSENNLYTVEAFNEYFDHLRPGGILAVSRLRRLVGDEALRITLLTLEALRERGIERPERHVVVALGRDYFNQPFGTTLARLRPWTPAELGRLRALARERGLGLAFAPGGPNRLEWAQLAEASSPQAFCSSYRLDVCPPTDDRPFFFQMRRIGSIGESAPGYIYSAEPFQVLLVTFAILAGLSLLIMAAPLALVARADRPPVKSLGFFAAIGLGFLTLEIALIQRFVLFLGFPTYALSVVLFALLVWTGAGSLLAGRVREPRRTLTLTLGIACALIAAAAFGLRPLLSSLIDLPFWARVLTAVLLLAPLGIVLGMAMPLGLTRLAALHPRGIAWAWGVNGIASVVASAGAITVAIVAGFPAATLVALGCYVAALVHVRFGAWPAAEPPAAQAPEHVRARPAVPAAAER